MTETKASLEKAMYNSAGGPCDFPEELRIPINSNQMSVRKRIRGSQGEPRRFKKLIVEMLKSGQLTPEQANEEWAKVG